MAATATATVTAAVSPPTAAPDLAFHTPADNIVLKELYQDIDEVQRTGKHRSAQEHHASLCRLDNLNDPQHVEFQPTVFSSWDFNLRCCLPIPHHLVLLYFSTKCDISLLQFPLLAWHNARGYASMV
jgi:hypothetical protein